MILPGVQIWNRIRFRKNQLLLRNSAQIDEIRAVVLHRRSFIVFFSRLPILDFLSKVTPMLIIRFETIDSKLVHVC